MMGAVPIHRRGIAAGTRMMLQNTGSVLSIAILLAIVTSAVPRSTLLSIFSGLTTGLSAAALDPFIHNLHVAMWVLAATSLLGAIVSLMRPRSEPRSRTPRWRRPMRIGEVAAAVGTTPRTIRYYEEIGLMPGAERPRGRGAPRPTPRTTSSSCARCCA